MTIKRKEEILGYYHPETNKKLTTLEGTTVFDMGKTVPGIEKKAMLVVKNEHDFPIELSNPKTSDQEFKIMDYPQFLKPGQTGKIEFAFSPSKERIVPLSTTWGFEITIG